MRGRGVQHRGAERGQRGAQVAVRAGRPPLFGLSRMPSGGGGARGGRGAGGGRRVCTKRRRFTVCLPRWRVDAVDQLVGQMLQLHGDRPGAGDGELAGGQALRRVTAARAGPTMADQSAITCAVGRAGPPEGRARQPAATACRSAAGHRRSRGGLAIPGFRVLCHRRSCRLAASLVRPAPAPSAVAERAGTAGGSVPRLAQRDHATADHGCRRHTLL